MARSQWCLMLCAIGGVGVGGCVSPSTWRALDDVSEAIRSADVDAPETVAPDGTYAFRTCADVARAVIATHPGLAGPRHRARAALARARAEGALPAPSARLEVWDFPIGDPQLADREGMYMLGVAQELPPAGALDGRARSLVEDARASLGELSEMRRELGASASHTCVEWAEAAQDQDRVVRWIAVLDRMRESVTARFSAGGGALPDLPRLDRERATALRALRRADGDRARAEATLRTHLGLTGDAELGTPVELPTAAPSLDPEALLRAAAGRGVLVQARARVAAAEARASASEASARVPTFMVGATYMQMPQARAGLGLELTMTLPWLWSGEGPLLDAAREDALADAADASSLERDIAVELRAALSELETVTATLAVLREEEAPATARALEAVGAAYAAGSGDLLDWLDAARALRELEVEEAGLRGALGHALADVESVVGAPLTEVSP